MKIKPIIVVSGEPYSVFLEIFFKSKKIKRIKKKILLIVSKKLLLSQMKILKFNYKLNIIDPKKINFNNLSNNKINIIDVKFNHKKTFDKISKKSNKYIEQCFSLALDLLNKNDYAGLINGPISKKNFLNKKLLGMTEYISEEFSVKKNAMLIYNKTLSVCPLTTHLPLKFVAKNITKNSICEKIILINKFYKKNLNKNPNIAVLGLNPHCESVSSYNEDEKVIKPTIQHLSKLGHRISGPFPADTIFLNENRKKYDVILGMYHDQVLTPIKTLFEYNAINITLGLPFIRISPDHGPNEQMLGKNLSNPLSLIQAISFMDKN